MLSQNDLSNVPAGDLFVQLVKNSISRTFLVDRVLKLDVPDSAKVAFIRTAQSANGIESVKSVLDQFDAQGEDHLEESFAKNIDWHSIGMVFEAHLAGATPQEKKPAEKSWVYFIESSTSGLIKIGRSVSPRDRFAAIRTMSPDELTLLGAIPEGQVTESDLHKKFSHLRRHGEWFEDCLEIREYLGGLELSV